MRVAILMGLPSPWSRATAEMLARLGHEVHVIDFAEAKGTYIQSGVQDGALKEFAQNVAKIHLLQGYGVSNFRYYKAAPALGRLLRQIKPDILMTLYAGGYAQLACLSRFRPYAIFAVGSDVLLQKGFRRWLARFNFERAAHVFANGKFLASKTRELAPGATVTPLLLGVDTEAFRPATPGAEVQLLCNRGFKDVYNNEAIIEALSRLTDVPPFTFHFASMGPKLDQARALATRILPPQIHRCVKFWGGVTNEQMLEILHQSRFFVSMSRSDGTATSLLEAMACGLFPILSDIPQNRDWVDAARANGALVPLDQPEALTEALRRAITNPGRADAAVTFNRSLILEQADARTNLHRLADMLGAIVGRSRPASVPTA